MESLEAALKVVSPLERESVLLCGSDLLLCEVTLQDFHLSDADDTYQNLRVNIISQCVCGQISSSDFYTCLWSFNYISVVFI